MHDSNQFTIAIEPVTTTLPSELTDYAIKSTYKARLDKWLWASRLFKTIALARYAIEHGRILYNGQQTKPGMEIELDAIVQIQQRYGQKIIKITNLSTRRRNNGDVEPLFIELATQAINNFACDHNKADHPDKAIVAPVKKVIHFLRKSFLTRSSSS